MEIEPGDLPYSQQYFPYGSFELISYQQNPAVMQYMGGHDTFVQPELFFSGQFTRPFLLHFNKPCKCFGISFWPWTGNILSNLPAADFTDRMIPLHVLDKNELLSARLTVAENNEEIFGLLEEYILLKARTGIAEGMCAQLTKSVMATQSRKDTGDLIRGIGLSRRRIEQLFLQSSGLTIGSFVGKIRFQKAVSLLQQKHTSLSFTNIGYEAGYYDQSHFIRGFKKYAGLTPSAFINQSTALHHFIGSLI